jgi:selenide,water dikinase
LKPPAASAAPVRDLLLVGGGHSHVQVLRRLAMAPWPGIRVTVVSRELHTPYSGMLPGLIAGHYAYDDVHIDLGPLCRAAGARLIGAAVNGIDLDARRVTLSERPALRFDVLSLNVGGTPGGRGVELGAGVVPVKPISAFLPQWEQVRADLVANARQSRVPSLAVVGGGAGGVEIALAIRHALAGVDCSLTLVTAGERLLEGHSGRVERRFREVLSACSISVSTGFKVVRAGDGAVLAADGRSFAADHVLWVTGVAAPAYVRAAGLAVDAEGFVRVDATLRSVSHPFVFAAGDVAALESPRPKAGVFAVRAGPVLTHNLEASLAATRLRHYRPQRRFLALISEGERRAVASRGAFFAEGAWVWRWKDRIDRRFMERFRLPAPPMPVPDLPPALAADAPSVERCGGCGAKLAGDLLARVLDRLAPAPHASVEQGIGEDAAILRVAGERLLVTVDGFRAMIDDPYRFGRICAHHALNDVYAMGGRPTAAFALATVRLGAHAMMEEDLFQLMSGACDVLRAENVALAGGHSSEGPELSLAFAVVGDAPAAPLRKSGLRDGDALVLTKAVGTGIVLAGLMRGLARSADVAATLDAMDRSNRDGLDVLRAFDAHACTDVTGFGLLGHLAEMLRASGVGAVIALDRVPPLPGALELLSAGVESSLAPANALVLDDFDCSEARADAALRLLIDPQTSGGLLAGVAADRAQACAEMLRARGYEAAVIGTVRAADRPGTGRVVHGD